MRYFVPRRDFKLYIRISSLALIVIAATGCTYRYRTGSFVAEEASQSSPSDEPVSTVVVGSPVPSPANCTDGEQRLVTLEVSNKLDEATSTITTIASTTHSSTSTNLCGRDE